LALLELGPDDQIRSSLEEVLAAAKRSADITRQLLAFSRQQTINPKVIDLNETVEGMLKMLRRLIGEDIDLTWNPGKTIWPVYMDPSQIDQIMVNLCVNARDAINDVGKITIETDVKTFDQACCADHFGCTPGDYVMLSVSDNGCGIDKETQINIFEPFFTTKEIGKGTGLGLATVYGIVKQNEGFISLSSQPGQGSSFMVYLPRHEPVHEEIHQVDTYETSQIGNETVLLVEDDTKILRMARSMLYHLGYNTYTASTPSEAVGLAYDNADDIQLLITDVVMPDMNGRELSEKIQAISPSIKVLYMSGYTSNVIAHRGVLDEGIHFIQKPFTMNDLSRKIRKALDE
jgi:CheY-like chemotaxis protein